MTAYSGDVGLYLSGGPVRIKECGIYIKPPSIRDILIYGENDFLLDTKIFSMDKVLVDAIRTSEPRLKDEEPWFILMNMLNADKSMMRKFMDYLALVVPDFEPSLENGNLLFKDAEGAMRGRIQQFNYEPFSVILKELFSPPTKGGEEFNPVNDKAAEIAAKLKKGREAANKAKGRGSSDDGGSLFGLYTSSLSIGLGIDINTLMKYTPFQIYDAFDRYVKKSEYDIYMKIQTTPMMSTEKMDEPQHWMSNLYNN